MPVRNVLYMAALSAKQIQIPPLKAFSKRLAAAGKKAKVIIVAVMQVELMHDLLPNSSVIAVLVNPRNNGVVFVDSAQSAAQRFGQRVVIGNANSDADFDMAFNTVSHQQAVGLVVTSDPLFATHHEQIASLAASHAIPTIFGDGELETGGLMSYGPRLPDMFGSSGFMLARFSRAQHRPTCLWHNRLIFHSKSI